MTNKTVTIPIEWFEGLLENMRAIAKIFPDRSNSIEWANLIGFIVSAEHVIKGGKDETNKV